MRSVRIAVTLLSIAGGAALTVLLADHHQVQAAQQLSDVELQQSLLSQGYTDIRDMRHDGNRVHLTALQNGQSIQLTVDGRTGQAVGEKGTDDDDDDD